MYSIIFKILNSICFFALLLFTENTYSQNSIESLKFENNTIYIFSRGTKTKSGIIAEKFNIKDRRITHVGIGFMENKELKIYNVIDVDTIKTALVIKNLRSFINDKVYYLSIWKCDNSITDFENLKKICNTYSSKKIYFDFSFNLNDGNSLYCSEFCSKVLQETNPVVFNFQPKVMKLDSFYKKVLERDVFLYYPVDFFEVNKCFTKIFETNFKSN